MTNPTEPDPPLEQAEDPADGHARTIAELVEAEGARKREQARQVFGYYPNEDEETDDAA
jgi:hypothetical protein